MNNFDFNSKKYTILLAVVCLGFLIITIKAFEYLPTRLSSDIDMQSDIASNVNSPASAVNKYNTAENTDDDEDDYEDDERHKSGHFDFMPKYDNETSKQDFDEIKAPAGAIKEDLPDTKDENNELSPNEEALKHYLNGKKLIGNNNYQEALKEFQKTADLSQERELEAMAYEEIAKIYTLNKKYGTALSFASKAYSISPNSAREMLIAQIYYKSGNTENAVSKVNSILKKGL